MLIQFVLVLYSWGYGYHNDPKEAGPVTRLYPNCVDACNEKIKDIIGGINSMAIVTEDHQILTWGKNECDVLGHLKQGNLAAHIIETPEKINNISIGMNHMIILGSEKTKKIAVKQTQPDVAASFGDFVDNVYGSSDSTPVPKSKQIPSPKPVSQAPPKPTFQSPPPPVPMQATTNIEKDLEDEAARILQQSLEFNDTPTPKPVAQAALKFQPPPKPEPMEAGVNIEKDLNDEAARVLQQSLEIGDTPPPTPAYKPPPSPVENPVKLDVIKPPETENIPPESKSTVIPEVISPAIVAPADQPEFSPIEPDVPTPENVEPFQTIPEPPVITEHDKHIWFGADETPPPETGRAASLAKYRADENIQEYRGPPVQGEPFQPRAPQRFPRPRLENVATGYQGKNFDPNYRPGSRPRSTAPHAPQFKSRTFNPNFRPRSTAPPRYRAAPPGVRPATRPGYVGKNFDPNHRPGSRPQRPPQPSGYQGKSYDPNYRPRVRAPLPAAPRASGYQGNNYNPQYRPRPVRPPVRPEGSSE